MQEPCAAEHRLGKELNRVFQTMIETNALAKNYGDICAVRELTLKVASGEVLGLLGLNGAGKTTSIRMLTTYIPPSSGTAKVAGFDILREAEQVRGALGYLPENPPLYPEMRVGEYLRFVGKVRDLRGSPLRSSVDEVLERCQLTGVVGRLCGELSKGYRQRVGIAQAIIHKPQVIILDEPTNGLDPAQILEVRTLIRSLQKKHTVILSTHILREVVEVCSSFAILANGVVVDQGAISSGERELEERFLRAVSGARASEKRSLVGVGV